MITEIKFLESSIIIEEEKKGLFGVKKKNIEINIEKINQVERQVINGKLSDITINYGEEYKLYFIEEQNYENDLNEVYENIIRNRINNLFEVIETDLTNGDANITTLMNKGENN